jgi:hypothetical protein
MPVAEGFASTKPAALFARQKLRLKIDKYRTKEFIGVVRKV